MTEPTTQHDGPRGANLRIGVLAGWLDDEYQSAVVRGVMEAAHGSGADLVCFNATVQHAPFRFGERPNVVYDLARSEGIDALVVLAGNLVNHVGANDHAGYFERYRPMPIASVAVEIEGTTSILIDGEPALRDGIRHLVDDHGYRQIAFICGPDGNPEASARLKTYRDVLTGYGRPPSDSLIAIGDYQYEGGVGAVRILLDEQDASFDAVVVANDQMALGAIDALRARGIRVPRDVAILGFDDISDARFSAPPLTTIRQPLDELGRLAVEVLLRRLRGEQVDNVLVLPTELVIRRSCGCASDARRADEMGDQPPQSDAATEITVDASLRVRRARILDAMRQPSGGQSDRMPPGWEEDLLDALTADLQGGPVRFVGLINAQLDGAMHSDGTGNAWHLTLSALRRELMPCLAADPTMQVRGEALIEEAQVLVDDAVEHLRAQHRLLIERRARALAETAEILGTVFDLESLGGALRECLPRLGVPSAYLVLGDETSLAGSRVAFAYDPDRDPTTLESMTDARISAPFKPGALLPVDRVTGVVVAPLFFQDDQLGYAVFEMGPIDGLIYDSLRAQISGALKVALLIRELQIRAVQLEEAYVSLQDNQQRLMSAQKMATLGRITANIAHELNTPVAAVRAALAQIDKRAIEYEASVGDDEVTREDHLEIVAEMRAAIDLARRAAERAAGFIHGIKTQTRDLAPQDKVRFDPVPVIEESLLLLSYDIRRASGGVSFEPPEHPIELLGTPGRLAQIVTNLVTNALDALPADGAGAVTLRMTSDDRSARLEVQDTGSGIPAELHDKIFEAMFTTKSLESGTGLGLSIVKDLVEGHFGGRIGLASEPGHGTTFTLDFPLAPED